MTVESAINILKTMPPDAEVWHLWDGVTRSRVEHIWLSNSGTVVTADCDEPCYAAEDKPVGVSEPWWTTPAADDY